MFRVPTPPWNHSQLSVWLHVGRFLTVTLDAFFFLLTLLQMSFKKFFIRKTLRDFNVYVCVQACLHVYYTCVHVPVCVVSGGHGQCWQSPSLPLQLFLRQGPLTGPGAHWLSWASWPAAPGLLLSLSLPHSGIPGLYLWAWLFQGLWRLNSSPHASTGSIL